MATIMSPRHPVLAEKINKVDPRMVCHVIAGQDTFPTSINREWAAIHPCTCGNAYVSIPGPRERQEDEVYICHRCGKAIQVDPHH